MSMKSQFLMEELMVASSAAHAEMLKEHEASIAACERQVNELAEINKELLEALKEINRLAFDEHMSYERMADEIAAISCAILTKAEK